MSDINKVSDEIMICHVCDELHFLTFKPGETAKKLKCHGITMYARRGSETLQFHYQEIISKKNMVFGRWNDYKMIKVEFAEEDRAAGGKVVYIDNQPYWAAFNKSIRLISTLKSAGKSDPRGNLKSLDQQTSFC
ncbi:hypothetical protein C0583_06795 [Candidatus Parcubacteria bacterium]|nr:MAG: hypothetical protein C0583_06795 [Candidatus Parcubacteria bacterium]